MDGQHNEQAVDCLPGSWKGWGQGLEKAKAKEMVRGREMETG